jgi:hypothetical protein
MLNHLPSNGCNMEQLAKQQAKILHTITISELLFTDTDIVLRMSANNGKT